MKERMLVIGYDSLAAPERKRGWACGGVHPYYAESSKGTGWMHTVPGPAGGGGFRGEHHALLHKKNPPQAGNRMRKILIVILSK